MFSSVRNRVDVFPPLAGVGFLAFVRGHLPQAGSVFFCRRLFRRLSRLLAGWFCAFVLVSSSQSRVCVGASTVCFSCIFLRDVVTLWLKSVFVTLDHERRITLVVVPFRSCHPCFGVEPSSSYVLLWIVGPSCSWCPGSYLACHWSLTVGCLLLASSAASL